MLAGTEEEKRLCKLVDAKENAHGHERELFLLGVLKKLLCMGIDSQDIDRRQMVECCCIF